VRLCDQNASIDKYYQEGAHVVIISQEKSFEAWDSFEEKGYELWLDTDVADAWKLMLTADLVILSQSSFPLFLAWHARAR
jgi:hypothetical protein